MVITACYMIGLTNKFNARSPGHFLTIYLIGKKARKFDNSRADRLYKLCAKRNGSLEYVQESREVNF